MKCLYSNINLSPSNYILIYTEWNQYTLRTTAFLEYLILILQSENQCLSVYSAQNEILISSAEFQISKNIYVSSKPVLEGTKYRSTFRYLLTDYQIVDVVYLRKLNIVTMFFSSLFSFIHFTYKVFIGLISFA